MIKKEADELEEELRNGKIRLYAYYIKIQSTGNPRITQSLGSLKNAV